MTDVASHPETLPAGARPRSQRIPLPLSPEQRLKREIGPRAYAKIMTALNKRFAALLPR